MPSERHINRQIQWRDALRKYGANASLERTIRIKGARIVVDVYAEIEGKTLLVEIGNINDERKTALMQYYADENSEIEFIHEPYGKNKIQQVLESLQSYRNSEEYQKQLEMVRQTRIEKLEKSIKLGAIAFGLLGSEFLIIGFYVLLLGAITGGLIFFILVFWMILVVIHGIRQKKRKLRELREKQLDEKPIFTGEQHRKRKMAEYCVRCGSELEDPDEIYWLYGDSYCEDCCNDEIEETDYPFIEDL